MIQCVSTDFEGFQQRFRGFQELSDAFQRVSGTEHFMGFKRRSRLFQFQEHSKCFLRVSEVFQRVLGLSKGIQKLSETFQGHLRGFRVVPGCFNGLQGASEVFQGVGGYKGFSWGGSGLFRGFQRFIGRFQGPSLKFQRISEAFLEIS